jgi:hypothetical protein
LSGLRFFLISYFTLGALGPVLSYFSLQELGLSSTRALTYSLVTFAFDGVSVLLFALFIKRFSLSYNRALYYSTLFYLPLWLFDLFDLTQETRFLSNLALPVSLYLIYKVLKSWNLRRRELLLSEALFLFLYVLNGLSSEFIAPSPAFRKLLGVPS